MDLKSRIAGLGDRSQAVQRLADDVNTERQHVERDLKIIPATADVADLIRKLSYQIDGVTVTDQTFTAGSPTDAIVGGASAAPTGPASAAAAAPAPQAMPVTAEMSATFDSVLGLIDQAENMNRLIRVASVRITCKRDDQKTDVPLLKASVGLEVIYGPSSGSSPTVRADGAKEGH
jgi:hypothetical protein